MYKAYIENRPSVPHPEPRMDVPIDEVSGQIIVPWYSYSSIQNAQGKTTTGAIASRSRR
jgi:hypothetical protein